MSNAPTAVKEPKYYVDVSGVKDGYLKDLCRVRDCFSQLEWMERLTEMAGQSWHGLRADAFRQAAAVLRGEG